MSVSMDEIRRDRLRLGNPYAHIEYLVESGASRKAAAIHRSQILLRDEKGASYTGQEIEKIVRRLHRTLWANRQKIWPDRKSMEAMQIIDPVAALAAFGYATEWVSSIGQYSDSSGTFEVAGLFDDNKAQVSVSEQFPLHIRNFTLAHELGHVVLGAPSGLHRERPVDGSRAQARNGQEWEADKFAACFLMPDRQVRAEFQARFLDTSFRISEASAFALTFGSASELTRACGDRRGLARLLAGARHYNGRSFYSLSERFDVSVGTMAIRLEELSLVPLSIVSK